MTDPRLTDPHAERAVLGACLLDGEVAAMVARRIKDVGAFSDVGLRDVFKAVRELVRTRQPVDTVTAQAQLRRAGALDRVGGAQALVSLMVDVHSTANADHYVEVVLERYRARRIRLIADKLQQSDPTASAGELAESVRVWLAAAEAGAPGEAPETAREAYDRALAERGHHVRIGWDAYDATYLGGWWPGWIHIVAARTSTGKTAWLVNAAVQAAQAGTAFEVYPWEPTRVGFLDLLAARLSGSTNEHVIGRWRELPDEERKRIRAAIDPVLDAGLLVASCPGERGAEDWPRAKDHWGENDARLDHVERQVEASPARVLAFDLFSYAMVMRRPDDWGRALDRVKGWAERYRKHLMLLHQVNRMPDEREDARPTLRHLKYSGALEETPRIVTGLYQPGLYRRVKEQTLEAEVLKQGPWKRGVRFEHPADLGRQFIGEPKVVKGERDDKGAGAPAAGDGGGATDEIDF